MIRQVRESILQSHIARIRALEDMLDKYHGVKLGENRELFELLLNMELNAAIRLNDKWELHNNIDLVEL